MFCQDAYCFNYQPCTLHPATSTTPVYRVGIVCTLKLPAFGACTLRSFLQYHLHKQFRPIFLFFDDPLDASLAVLEEFTKDKDQVNGDEEFVAFRNDGSLLPLWQKTSSYDSLKHCLASEVQVQSILSFQDIQEKII